MRTNKSQSGVALIELGISIFLLVTIVFGITEFGRAVYQYNALAKAARDGVRFLAVKDATVPGTVAEAKCVVVYGNLSCSGSPLVPNLTVAMVSVCQPLDPACTATHQAQGASPVINLVTVTIGGGTTPYVFQSLASFVVPDIAFSAISATMRQVL